MLAMVPLVILSVVSGAILSTWNDKIVIASDVNALPSSMDGCSVIFLGSSPESNPILDTIETTTTNIVRSDDLSVLDTVNESNSMVLIDGVWAQKENHDGLVIALRSLVVAGVPVVIINGDADIIREAVENDKRIGYMISTSPNSLCSAGIHYDATRHCGESYDYSSINGDLALAGMNAYQWCAQFLHG